VHNKTVSIYIHKGKAYIPTLAKTEWGVYINTDPVSVSNLGMEDLIAVIQYMFEKGNPIIPQPSREEIKNLPQPLLKAAKVSSWKQLAQGGTTYSIYWKPEGIFLDFFKKDEKGRFITDISKGQKFAPETNLQQIVQIILEDIQSHPELLN
jgi:hypothetical protein